MKCIALYNSCCDRYGNYESRLVIAGGGVIGASLGELIFGNVDGL